MHDYLKKIKKFLNFNYKLNEFLNKLFKKNYYGFFYLININLKNIYFKFSI